MESLTYEKTLKTPNYENYETKSREIDSGRYKSTRKILKPINLQGHGIENINVPTSIFDIHNSFEIF